MPKETVTLTLSKDEALALFELTSRFSDIDELAIEHQSEERLLWNICCKLESVLAEPFRADYRELLHQAREALKDSVD